MDVSVMYALAVLKGAFEQEDTKVYLGRTMPRDHVHEALNRGWIAKNQSVTREGRKLYQRLGLAELPHHGQVSLWDWRYVKEAWEQTAC